MERGEREEIPVPPNRWWVVNHHCPSCLAQAMAHGIYQGLTLGSFLLTPSFPFGQLVHNQGFNSHPGTDGLKAKSPRVPLPDKSPQSNGPRCRSSRPLDSRAQSMSLGHRPSSFHWVDLFSSPESSFQALPPPCFPVSAQASRPRKPYFHSRTEALLDTQKS